MLVYGLRRLPPLQFGLRTLFVVLTAAAILAWWPKYGQPRYEAWRARAGFLNAVRAGDAEAFVISLERLESVLREQPGNERLWESSGRHPPDPLPVDDALAGECTGLLAEHGSTAAASEARSPSSRVRVLATLAVSLIRRQPRLEVRRLTALLGDDCPEVRAIAACCLNCYGDEARSAVPALTKMIRAKRLKTVDSVAAFATLAELDDGAAMAAAGLGGMDRVYMNTRPRPSSTADKFLGVVYPGYREQRLIERFLAEELQSCSARLSAAKNKAERDLCHAEIDKLQAELQRVRAALRKSVTN